MSTWVECLDGYWVNLTRVLELDEEETFFVQSRHETEADARQTAERLLIARLLAEILRRL